MATVGIEFFTKEEKVNDKIIRVKIWDTAGQEQYKSLSKNFFRNADGVIIVYDVSNRRSFEKVAEWIKSIEDNVSSEKNIQKVIVGNKIDLARQVSTEEGNKLSQTYNIPFFEVSAKNSIGINEFMTSIITNVVNFTTTSKQGVGLIENNNNSDKKASCAC